MTYAKDDLSPAMPLRELLVKYRPEGRVVVHLLAPYRLVRRDRGEKCMYNLALRAAIVDIEVNCVQPCTVFHESSLELSGIGIPL